MNLTEDEDEEEKEEQFGQIEASYVFVSMSRYRNQLWMNPTYIISYV